jgi:hypothetical protein
MVTYLSPGVGIDICFVYILNLFDPECGTKKLCPALDSLRLKNDSDK